MVRQFTFRGVLNNDLCPNTERRKKLNVREIYLLQGRKHKKRIAVGDPITIKGQLNGRLEIEKTQANSWFAKKYFGKNAIMVLTDSYK